MKTISILFCLLCLPISFPAADTTYTLIYADLDSMKVERCWIIDSTKDSTCEVGLYDWGLIQCYGWRYFYRPLYTCDTIVYDMGLPILIPEWSRPTLMVNLRGELIAPDSIKVCDTIPLPPPCTTYSDTDNETWKVITHLCPVDYEPYMRLSDKDVICVKCHLIPDTSGGE